MSSEPTGLIEVALPVPLFQTFTYALDPASETIPVAGSRVVVPFRNRKEIGICLGPSEGLHLRQKPKRVIEVPDATPALSESMISLCRWMADYYIVPLGVVLRTALPASLTGAEQPRPQRKTQRIVRLRGDLPTLTHREKQELRHDDAGP